MIPLRDNQPTSRFPIVTVIVIAINVVVFLAQQRLPLETSFAMVPYEITHGTDLSNVVAHLTRTGAWPLYQLPPGGSGLRLGSSEIFYGPSPHPLWLTIFTSMFLHSGWLHIGSNMLVLWVFGNNIEDVLGKVRFLLFYFACGLVAALTQIATDANSIIPTVGASGAIAGVMGAYLILYPHARVLSIVPLLGLGLLMEVRAFWVLLFWIVLNIFQGVSGFGVQQGGVAHFAHIGGFFAGLGLILLLGGPRLVARQKQRSEFYYPPPSGHY
ncbi:MAG: rhomboid family intramembrane serine protease [Armatimonadota bacterium]|nr:rhomboid family intramembrane serine protease [Armatimonadota bacterium]